MKKNFHNNDDVSLVSGLFAQYKINKMRKICTILFQIIVGLKLIANPIVLPTIEISKPQKRIVQRNDVNLD